MAIVYAIPRRRYYGNYGYPYYYPNYPYVKYPLFKDSRFFAMNAEVDKEKLIAEIVKIIVSNQKELKEKLVELGLVCSCTIGDADEKDLSEIVVEKIEDKKLQQWLAERTSRQSDDNISNDNAIAIIADKTKKDEYKKAIIQAVTSYKATTGRESGKFKENAPMIIGAAILLTGIALIYFNSIQKQKA